MDLNERVYIMDTKLSVALLSGLSLFMSVGAYAVADGEQPADYMNWSYATGVIETPAVTDFEFEEEVEVPCMAGKCPLATENETLTLTYEDEALPIAERLDTYVPLEPVIPAFEEPQERPYAVSVRKHSDEIKQPGQQVEFEYPEPTVSYHFEPTKSETNYVQDSTKMQYPITRQYPISVQYPVSVQREITVEQPVIMQQPVIVRRPVVMQQEVTVQRQPTVLQQQPVVMQQQPTYLQQQPVVVQAPAGSVNPAEVQAFMANMPQQLPMNIMAQPVPSVPMQQQVVSGYANQPKVQPVTVPAQPKQVTIPSQPQAVPTYSVQPMTIPTLAPVPAPQQYTVPTTVPAQPVMIPMQYPMY
jgi:hypothetical protein